MGTEVGQLVGQVSTLRAQLGVILQQAQLLDPQTWEYTMDEGVESVDGGPGRPPMATVAISGEQADLLRMLLDTVLSMR